MKKKRLFVPYVAILKDICIGMIFRNSLLFLHRRILLNIFKNKMSTKIFNYIKIFHL